jgi:hypothetical protein
MALNGVQFDWKSNGRHDIGFIAQEVKKQIPEIVNYNTKKDIYSVDYAKVVPFLVEAMKTQQGMIEKNNQLLKEQDEDIKKLQQDLKNIIKK